jgi:hypothetical protein
MNYRSETHCTLGYVADGGHREKNTRFIKGQYSRYIFYIPDLLNWRGWRDLFTAG